MDDMLKMLLENINKNIDTLRVEYNLKLENLNNNIDILKTEFKDELNELSNKIDEIKNNYVNKGNCEEIRENNNNNIQLKRDEISLKKITIIVSSISAGIASIIGFISQYFPR